MSLSAAHSASTAVMPAQFRAASQALSSAEWNTRLKMVSKIPQILNSGQDGTEAFARSIIDHFCTTDPKTNISRLTTPGESFHVFLSVLDRIQGHDDFVFELARRLGNHDLTQADKERANSAFVKKLPALIARDAEKGMAMVKNLLFRDNQIQDHIIGALAPIVQANTALKDSVFTLANDILLHMGPIKDSEGQLLEENRRRLWALHRVVLEFADIDEGRSKELMLAVFAKNPASAYGFTSVISTNYPYQREKPDQVKRHPELFLTIAEHYAALVREDSEHKYEIHFASLPDLAASTAENAADRVFAIVENLGAPDFRSDYTLASYVPSFARANPERGFQLAHQIIDRSLEPRDPVHAVVNLVDRMEELEAIDAFKAAQLRQKLLDHGFSTEPRHPKSPQEVLRQRQTAAAHRLLSDALSPLGLEL